jgi:hypothetical protein
MMIYESGEVMHPVIHLMDEDIVPLCDDYFEEKTVHMNANPKFATCPSCLHLTAASA